MGEKFAANPVTGTGSMSVPLATSPGRAGFSPQLSLAYDSGAGNGPFGLGWSLALPAITRKTDKGLPRYQDAAESDVFILSGAEDLVPIFKQDEHGNWIPNAQGGYLFDEVERDDYLVRRYRPRIEGLFARIERWANTQTGETHWRSITRDNITTLYGQDNQSRIFDPADPRPDHPTRIFSWLICASYDDKGNTIVYEYAEEDSERIFENVRGARVALAHERNREANRTANRYIKRIKYGNRAPNRDESWQATDPAQLPADGWMFEVVFDYGEGHYAEDRPDGDKRITARAQSQPPPGASWPVRQDPFSSYRAGFEVRTYRLCRQVLMFHHFPQELGIADCLVRSTEFAYAESPIATVITSVTQSGYVRQPALNWPNRYLKKSLPPLDFEYSQATIQTEIREIDLESLENLPYGLDGAHYQWVDLDGEGLSGMLTEQAGGWFYKRNLSPLNVQRANGLDTTVARFAPVELVAQQPSLAAINSGQQQFLDLAGDGLLDLVQFHRPLSGYYERTADESWSPFVPFESSPTLAWDDPNLKLVDLTGDGHADILLTEDEIFTWYPSQAELGFGPAERVCQQWDEEKGPHLIFGDGTQSIYLADLSGDGLTDLVRIRNGDVCYWPNLGYGRFGAKVTMDDAPWFEEPELFDQHRIRLADIDGSGTTDIIYLGPDGVHLYFNQSGNRWSAANTLPSFPPIDNLAAVQTVDLLGNGTACLVWSSPLPGEANRPMRYMDLMGGQKPHLLIKTVNNLGAETVVQYVPSTKFYLQDKMAGRPWITKVPFPVHVVERVETYDRISHNRFVTRYAYHHGYFDGHEREFRGFGLVEQWDTEEYRGDIDIPEGETTNWNDASWTPPMLTRTWFHTGAFVEAGAISRQYAHEYWVEPALRPAGRAADRAALLLPDTVLPPDLTTDEVREAYRALKGMALRIEVYAEDGSPQAEHPYTVTEQNFTIRRLQPQAGKRHAVFFTHAREAISYHYERNPADPRISHALTLQVDQYGHVLRSIAVGYPRADVADRRSEQNETHLTLTLDRFAHRDDQLDWRHIGLPVETRTYEVVKPPAAALRFAWQDLHDLVAALVPLLNEVEPIPAMTVPYEQWDWRKLWNPGAEPGGLLPGQPTHTRLRVIEHVRTLYRPDDMGVAQNDALALLPFGQVESLALPGESYKLAFTPGLLAQIYKRKLGVAPEENLLPDPLLVLGGTGGDEAGYVDLNGNGPHLAIGCYTAACSIDGRKTECPLLYATPEHGVIFLPMILHASA